MTAGRGRCRSDADFSRQPGVDCALATSACWPRRSPEITSAGHHSCWFFALKLSDQKCAVLLRCRDSIFEGFFHTLAGQAPRPLAAPSSNQPSADAASSTPHRLPLIQCDRPPLDEHGVSPAPRRQHGTGRLWLCIQAVISLTLQAAKSAFRFDKKAVYPTRCWPGRLLSLPR
jgi:hypothetical protein